MVLLPLHMGVNNSLVQVSHWQRDWSYFLWSVALLFSMGL